MTDAYAAAGVSIEAGDKAVELMKTWVEKASRPEVIGGIGGFAGLFDASALKKLRPAAAGHLRRRGRHQGRHRPGDGQARHHRLRPGRHARRRPGRLRRRAAVPHRLHRHRPGRPRADRRDRQGHRRGLRRGRLRPDRRRDGRAPRAARARRVRRRRLDHRRRRGRRGCSARAGSAPATWSSRWPRAGCTPTATRWSATCCSPTPGPAGRSTATSPSSAARSARSCSSRPGSTPRPASTSPTGTRRSTRCPTSPAAGWPPTWRGCCPSRSTATIDRATWTPAPVFDLVRRVGAVPQADLEMTLNCGVGMVALVAADAADRAVAVLGRARRPSLGGGRGHRRRA